MINSSVVNLVFDKSAKACVAKMWCFQGAETSIRDIKSCKNWLCDAKNRWLRRFLGKKTLKITSTQAYRNVKNKKHNTRVIKLMVGLVDFTEEVASVVTKKNSREVQESNSNKPPNKSMHANCYRPFLQRLCASKEMGNCSNHRQPAIAWFQALER